MDTVEQKLVRLEQVFQRTTQRLVELETALQLLAGYEERVEPPEGALFIGLALLIEGGRPCPDCAYSNDPGYRTSLDADGEEYPHYCPRCGGLALVAREVDTARRLRCAPVATKPEKEMRQCQCGAYRPVRGDDGGETGCRACHEIALREQERDQFAAQVADVETALLRRFDPQATGSTDLSTWIKDLLARVEAAERRIAELSEPIC